MHSHILLALAQLSSEILPSEISIRLKADKTRADILFSLKQGLMVIVVDF